MDFERVFSAKERRSIVRCAGVILPATVLGVAAMVADGISPMMWGQQIAAYLVFPCLALLLGGAFRRIPASVRTAALMLFLCSTLLGTEVGGAKRWLDLGLFNVNAAMLVLPALIFLMHGMKSPWPAMLCAAAVLSAQPDLSQLAAFSAAALFVLWKHRKQRIWSAASLVLMSVSIIMCMGRPTAIEPVSYCEGVLPLLGSMSILLLAAGYLALALVPGFLAYRFCREGGIWLLSLAVYYGMIMLFSLSGAYPVPFMGFGLSPFAGYWFACMCMECVES